MARLNEEGIVWFPCPTDIEGDRRIQQLMIEHPDKGYEIWDRFTRWIYNDYGYFKEWNDRQARYFGGKCYTTAERAKAIITTCLREGLFHQEVFDKYQVLTSFEIQYNYIHACARRKECIILHDFALINDNTILKSRSAKALSRAVYFGYPTENISSLFVDGFRREDWKDLLRLELVIPAGQKVDGPAPDQPDEPEQPSGINGQEYGTKTPRAGMDWEQEKKKLIADVEWKTAVARLYSGPSAGKAALGTWGDGNKFTPDFEKVDQWLEAFFLWCFVQEKLQTAQLMKGYFANWYNKREEMVKMIPADKRKTSLHLGDQDYENMTKW